MIHSLVRLNDRCSLIGLSGYCFRLDNRDDVTGLFCEEGGEGREGVSDSSTTPGKRKEGKRKRERHSE